MKILYASHTYIVGENQKKLTAIAAKGGIELSVVVPHVWKEPILTTIYPFVDKDERASIKVFPTKIILPGNEMRFMYMSLDLYLPKVQPDIIVVENGAGALNYTQFLLYKRMFAPQAKVVFFTWWNIPYKQRQPFRAIESYNIKSTDGAIVGNKDAEFVLRQQGYDGPLIRLPQLGVDTTVFVPENTVNLQNRLDLGDFVIGFVGRLVPEKGIQVLMDALDRFDGKFDLVILGAGEMDKQIRKWSDGLSVGRNVHLYESVTHDQVPSVLRLMDLLVLPSLTTENWKEQFGHVLIEAMSCEVAVIGSDSAEIPNVIGDSGIVVPENDPKELCDAICQLAKDSIYRNQLAAKGRERVLEKYTHEKIADKTVMFFEELLSKQN